MRALPSSAPQQKWWKYFNFQRRIVFLPSTVCCFQHFTFLTWVSSSQLRELWVVRASLVAPLTKLLSNTRRIHKLFLFSSQTASDYSQSQWLPPWAHLAAVNNRVPYNNAVWKYRCTIFGEGTIEGADYCVFITLSMLKLRGAILTSPHNIPTAQYLMCMH